jgi:hypothetical protein
MGRKAGVPQRNSLQVMNDRLEIIQRYLRGEYQSSIGEALNLSQQMVSIELKKIQAEWLERGLQDFDALKSAELAKLDLLERTYWAAWEASKKELSSRTQNIKQSGGRDARPESQQLIIRTDERVGDKRWLEGVQWCIAKRAEILGLNAPTKVSPPTPDGKQPAVLGIGIYLPQKDAPVE